MFTDILQVQSLRACLSHLKIRKLLSQPVPRRSLMRFARVIPEHISVVRVQVCQSRQNWYRQHSDQWQSGSSRLNKATWLHGAISLVPLCFEDVLVSSPDGERLQMKVCTRWFDSVSGEWLASQAEIEKTKSKSDLAVLKFCRTSTLTSPNVRHQKLPKCRCCLLPPTLQTCSCTLSGFSSKRKVLQMLKFQKCGTREALGESCIGLVYIKMLGYGIPMCSYTYSYNVKQYKKDSRSEQFVRNMHMFFQIIWQTDRYSYSMLQQYFRDVARLVAREMFGRPPFPTGHGAFLSYWQ